MLYFLEFLEFAVSTTVLSLGLVLGLDDSDFKGWPVALILLVTAGAWSLFVILLAYCFSDGTGEVMGLLHVMAFGIGLAAFIIALTNFPYTPVCVLTDFSGCQTLKAAIALDGVLWVLFLLTSLIIWAYASRSSRPRNVEVRRQGRVYYYR